MGIADNAASEGAGGVGRELPILVPHFTPDPTKVIQNITTTVADRLGANPRLARGVLTPRQYASGVRNARVAPMQYGNAVELMAAQEIRDSPLHRQLFNMLVANRTPTSSDGESQRAKTLTSLQYQRSQDI